MEEIDLYDLLRFYVKKWLTVAIFVMVGAISGIVYTYFIQSPEYTSKATLLLVGTNRTSSTQDSVVLNNYVQLFTSRRVLDSVVSDQSYDKGYDTLAANTTAQNVKNTDIINVSISTQDAKQSKALLEDAIGSFRAEAKELYGDSSIKISVVDNASQPTRPTNIKPVVQIGLAVAAAFVLSLVSLFFMYDYRHAQASKKTTRGKSAATSVAKPKTKQKKAKSLKKKVADALIGDDRQNGSKKTK